MLFNNRKQAFNDPYSINKIDSMLHPFRTRAVFHPDLQAIYESKIYNSNIRTINSTLATARSIRNYEQMSNYVVTVEKQIVRDMQEMMNKASKINQQYSWLDTLEKRVADFFDQQRDLSEESKNTIINVLIKKRIENKRHLLTLFQRLDLQSFITDHVLKPFAIDGTAILDATKEERRKIRLEKERQQKIKDQQQEELNQKKAEQLEVVQQKEAALQKREQELQKEKTELKKSTTSLQRRQTSTTKKEKELKQKERDFAKQMKEQQEQFLKEIEKQKSELKNTIREVVQETQKQVIAQSADLINNEVEKRLQEKLRDLGIELD